jgi:hypothetical protein
MLDQDRVFRQRIKVSASFLEISAAFVAEIVASHHSVVE